jgi:hypothetical protein
LKFLCLLEYEGKVIFFRPVVHTHCYLTT